MGRFVDDPDFTLRWPEAVLSDEIRRLIVIGECQWPIGSARGRTVELPAGGQQNCPVMAIRTARGFRCRAA